MWEYILSNQDIPVTLNNDILVIDVEDHMENHILYSDIYNMNVDNYLNFFVIFVTNVLSVKLILNNIVLMFMEYIFKIILHFCTMYVNNIKVFKHFMYVNNIENFTEYI